VLDRDPGALQDAFGRLFASLGAESVLRFLDEDTSIRAELRLMACLPPLPYLRAAATAAAVAAAGVPAAKVPAERVRRPDHNRRCPT
jgi:hypothetical protein